jgi:hypothetical protein
MLWLEPVHGIFGGDLKNASLVRIKPKIFRLQGRYHTHYGLFSHLRAVDNIISLNYLF